MTEGVKKPVRIVPHGQKGLLVFLQILEQVADGQHGGHQAVRHAHAQLIFDRHAQFHGIQAVGAHVRHNLCRGAHSMSQRGVYGKERDNAG